jgi:hypothetical protein
MPMPSLILTKNLDKSNSGVIFREPPDQSGAIPVAD